MKEETTRGSVFISWVREDAEAVQRLAADLTALGVDVWLDRDSIKPGQPWQAAIRSALLKGRCLIACFSKNYETRARTYMNEEIRFAAEIRYYQGQRNWLVPVLLSKCKLPEFYIAPSQLLTDLNPVDLTHDWMVGVRQIARLAIEIQATSIPTQLNKYKPYVPMLTLRSSPSNLTDQEVVDMIRNYDFYERDYNPSGIGPVIQLQFLDNETESVAFERRTGLLWYVDAKRVEMLPHRAIPDWLSRLNKQAYAGFNNWRLPTLPEAMSLIESRGYHDHRFGFPLGIWTSDRGKKGAVWVVGYRNGDCGRLDTDDYWKMSVRAVCSWSPSES